MKSLFKYISFFLLLLNGYGHLHADNLKDNNDFVTKVGSFQNELDLDLNFDYFDDSDALIHEESKSNPDRKFSETEEVEIEEAQNDADSDKDTSKKYLGGSDYVTSLFYTVLYTNYDYNRSDSITHFSNQYDKLSYPSFFVRYCVFRI